VNHRASLPIVVVGAGIGGLAAALAIARRGFDVQIIEQAREFKEIGAGVQFGPNAYKMMERLGLRDAINHLAVIPHDLIMMDSISSEVVTRIPVGEEFHRRFKYPYSLVHRADLHSVLLAACKVQPGIQMNQSCTMEQFEDTGDAIRLSTIDGRHFEGAALIGADGIWSKVRDVIVNDGAPRVSGHIAYRAVLPIEDVPEQYRQNAMILWAGPKNHLVQYPLRGGKLFNLVAVFHSDKYVEGWNSTADPVELDARFSGTCETVQALLSKISTWRMWVLCDREPVRHWSRGRATLLGDAAHPMLQYLAQGACMAIEDGVALADRMDESNGQLVEAFKEYEDVRYKRTGKCQLLARLYGEFYHAEGVRRELRNDMLGDRSTEQSYDGLAWLYDGI
jgi:2-polyprenyl-6-methoxyphenol hydroxylase-like FAD-dependent oxidoreductase